MNRTSLAARTTGTLEATRQKETDVTDATNTPPQPDRPVVPTPPAAPSYEGSYPPPPAASQQPAYTPPIYPASAPQGYGQQGYPQGGYGYAAPRPTNVLAIISLISAIAGLSLIPFLGSIAAVITGHMSLKQIERTGENGRGLALGGTIVGWISLGLWVLGIIIAVLFFIGLAAAGASYGSYPS